MDLEWKPLQNGPFQIESYYHSKEFLLVKDFILSHVDFRDGISDSVHEWCDSQMYEVEKNGDHQTPSEIVAFDLAALLLARRASYSPPLSKPWESIMSKKVAAQERKFHWENFSSPSSLVGMILEH